MDNPLERPVPTDSDERIKEFARDLAWGVENKQWENGFPVSSMGGMMGETWSSPNVIYSPFQTDFQTNVELRFDQLLWQKWNNQPPRSEELVSHGYLESNDANPYTLHQRSFRLTEKALSLLAPVRPLSVFISHKQSTSSAFALLIEARIKEFDPDISVFIDKELLAGSALRKKIFATIREFNTLICIYSPKTPCSDYVFDEVNFALNLEHNVIPVWHLGYKGEGRYPEELKGLLRVEVSKESAKSYETALDELLEAIAAFRIKRSA